MGVQNYDFNKPYRKELSKIAQECTSDTKCLKSTFFCVLYKFYICACVKAGVGFVWPSKNVVSMTTTNTELVFSVSTLLQRKK